jgi:hypothetical protein
MKGRPETLKRRGFNDVLFDIQRALQTIGWLFMRERITMLWHADGHEILSN